MSKKYVIICILILTKQILQVESRLFVKFKGVACEPIDDKYLKFTVCRMKAVKRDVVEMSVHVKLFKKPINNVSIHFNIKRRGYSNTTPLLELTVNACAFLKSKHQNPLAEWLYKILGFEKFSNLNHSCPYNHDLIFDKYRIDQAMTSLSPLGAFALGSYTLLTSWYTYNVHRANVKAHFELTDQ